MLEYLCEECAAKLRLMDKEYHLEWHKTQADILATLADLIRQLDERKADR